MDSKQSPTNLEMFFWKRGGGGRGGGGGGEGGGGQLSASVSNHFNPNNFLLILLQISSKLSS